MNDLIVKVRDFIDKHSLISQGDRILLSLSAGKDSMMLLHIMNELRQDYGFTIGLFHLNHMTRGAESDRDEGHLIRVAGDHDIPIHIEHHDFHRNKIPGTSFEDQARKMRYKLAEAICRKHGYNKIATAHTMSDHIETVLMRIFTGTGVYGLQGISERREAIIRPLLEITSGEIYEFLTANDISWLEDSSNLDVSYIRNFIRHDVLPLVKSRFPMADESLKSLSVLAGETMLLLDELIAQLYPRLYERVGNDLYIDTAMLIHSQPLFCHAVSAGMRKYFNYQASRKVLGELYEKHLIKRANINLHKNKTLRIDKVFTNSKSMLKISTNTTPDQSRTEWSYIIDLRGSGEQRLHLAEIGISITITTSDRVRFEKYKKNNRYVFISLEKNIKSIYIRNRRRGDRMRTEAGSKKIKDMFIEKKIGNDSKNLVPLLIVDTKVAAFMPGFLFDTPNRVAVDFLVDKYEGKVLSVFKN